MCRRVPPRLPREQLILWSLPSRAYRRVPPRAFTEAAASISARTIKQVVNVGSWSSTPFDPRKDFLLVTHLHSYPPQSNIIFRVRSRPTSHLLLCRIGPSPCRCPSVATTACEHMVYGQSPCTFESSQVNRQRVATLRRNLEALTTPPLNAPSRPVSAVQERRIQRGRDISTIRHRFAEWGTMFIQMCCSFSPARSPLATARGGRPSLHARDEWGVGWGQVKLAKSARPTASLICRRGTAVAHGGRVGAIA